MLKEVIILPIWASLVNSHELRYKLKGMRLKKGKLQTKTRPSIANKKETNLFTKNTWCTAAVWKVRNVHSDMKGRILFCYDKNTTVNMKTLAAKKRSYQYLILFLELHCDHFWGYVVSWAQAGEKLFTILCCISPVSAKGFKIAFTRKWTSLAMRNPQRWKKRPSIANSTRHKNILRSNKSLKIYKLNHFIL